MGLEDMTSAGRVKKGSAMVAAADKPKRPCFRDATKSFACTAKSTCLNLTSETAVASPGSFLST